MTPRNSLLRIRPCSLLALSLLSFLAGCGDNDLAFQARTVVQTGAEKVSIGEAWVDPFEKLVYSPQISFQGRGDVRMSACLITVFHDLNQNGRRDPEEQAYHWQKEWANGSERRVALPPEKKPLKDAERVQEGVFRYEVEVTTTKGHTCYSTGEVKKKAKKKK